MHSSRGKVVCSTDSQARGVFQDRSNQSLIRYSANNYKTSNIVYFQAQLPYYEEEFQINTPRKPRHQLIFSATSVSKANIFLGPPHQERRKPTSYRRGLNSKSHSGFLGCETLFEVSELGNHMEKGMEYGMTTVFSRRLLGRSCRV